MSSITRRLFGRKSIKSQPKLEKIDKKKETALKVNTSNYKEEKKNTLDEEYMKQIKPSSSP